MVVAMVLLGRPESEYRFGAAPDAVPAV